MSHYPMADGLVPKRSLRDRLRAAFAVHPHGETAVSKPIAADLAARTRRRARAIAWTGFLSAFPMFYIDHWAPYQAGLWANDPAYHLQILAWRVFSFSTLGAYLVWERRAPATQDRRLASVFSALAIVQGASFGIWFEVNEPSFPMYSFLLLVLAVLLQPPSRWALGAYAAAVPIVVVGALLCGTAPRLVAEASVGFVISTVLIVLVDRLVYRQVYLSLESEHLLSRANEALREAQARVVASERQAERLRISRDLHDSVGAQLSSLLAGVELARLEHGASGGSGDRALDEVERDAREAMQQLRETVWALTSESIPVDELASQLRRFAEPRAQRLGATVEVRVSGDRALVLPSAQALHLYRIGQEAVQNAVKHSGCTRIRVEITAVDGSVEIAVTDDGTFRPAVAPTGDGAPAGFGMHTMRERAEALGGRLDVETEAGTTVRAVVPLAV